MKNTLTKYHLLLCLMFQLLGCSSTIPKEVLTEKINFLDGPVYLNNLFQNKDVYVKLMYENSVSGRFDDATSEHIIIQTLSENKYIPLSQIISIKVEEKQTVNNWLITAAGAVGAVIGGIILKPDNESDLVEDHDLSTVLSSTRRPLIGATVGSIIGASAGYIINNSSTHIQPIEYVSISSPQTFTYKTVGFNVQQLIRRWDKKGINFLNNKAKIKKLLTFSKFLILDDLIGIKIDLRENNKYALFPQIRNFYEAYLFKLNTLIKGKNKYFSIIITKSSKAKFKLLKDRELLNMKFKLQ